MKSKVSEKEQAITLRKQGKTYNEISELVPVSKSSLSVWLRDLPLTSAEKVVLKKRRDKNISKGRIMAASANRNRKLERNEIYLKDAKEAFALHREDTLFSTGVALYWAEGAKRNEMFHFMNSDVEMIKLMLLWLENFTEYSKEDLSFRLYLHKPYIHENWELWWAKNLGVKLEQFKKVIVKPTQLGIKKRPNYKGCLRIEVPKSSKLLTKMKFWINMSVEYQLER